MTETTDFRCPICGNGRVVDAARANPQQRLLRCVDCGHIFVAQSGLVDEENEEVQLEYFGEAFATRTGFFVTLYDYINARRTTRALKLGTQKRVLEIGPGSGAVMGRLASLGHDVRGLDLSPAVARQIQRRWDLTVAVESLNSHIRSVGDGVYDAIIMRHVLEHFTDPFDALRGVRALLKPGGKIYIAVPNMDSWHRHFSGWSGYEPYHVHYFGGRSLSLALGRAGFRVLEMASFEPITGWANTCLRSFASQGEGPGGVQGPQSGWKRWALESMRLTAGIALSPLRWFQALMGRGEELTAVSEKTVS